MNQDSARILRQLLRERSTAALGTLQGAEPFVSMVPYALDPTGRCLILHASQLAAHTRNMQEHERVSLLITEPESPSQPPQGLARVTIQGIAREAGSDRPSDPRWRESYLQRFPAAAPLFDFPDFRLFLVEVTSARLVAGFAQAWTLDADQFAACVTRDD